VFFVFFAVNGKPQSYVNVIQQFIKRTKLDLMDELHKVS